MGAEGVAGQQAEGRTLSRPRALAFVTSCSRHHRQGRASTCECWGHSLVHS